MSIDSLLNDLHWALIFLYGIVAVISITLFIYSIFKKRFNKITLIYLMIFFALLTRMILATIPMSIYNQVEKHVYLQMVKKIFIFLLKI